MPSHAHDGIVSLVLPLLIRGNIVDLSFLFFLLSWAADVDASPTAAAAAVVGCSRRSSQPVIKAKLPSPGLTRKPTQILGTRPMPFPPSGPGGGCTTIACRSRARGFPLHCKWHPTVRAVDHQTLQERAKHDGGTDPSDSNDSVCAIKTSVSYR